jgi:hypothetical protein
MKRITEDKAKIIAAEYMLCKGDKIQALLNCGYSDSYSRSPRGNKVFDNIYISKEIDRLQAKTELICEITRESQINDLEKVKTDAVLASNPAAYVSAVREQNAILGLHRELAPNAEKEAVRAAKMAAEDRKLAEIAAKARTEQEAEEPKIKLVKAG